MREAVLYINKSDSRCGFCNKGADPYELTHETLMGWYAVNDNMKGCGATFIAVGSDYFHITEDDLHDMRPDLPYAGSFDPFIAPEMIPWAKRIKE